jgi:hypothetical protein
MIRNNVLYSRGRQGTTLRGPYAVSAVNRFIAPFYKVLLQSHRCACGVRASLVLPYSR